MGQFRADLKHFNEFSIVSNEWLQRRQRIIKRINEAVDYLNKLNTDTRTADIVGTSVSIAGGVVATAALLAVPFTGGLSACAVAAFAGGAQLTGTATSIGAHMLRGEFTKSCLEGLKSDLEKDKADLIEIQRLVATINDVMKGINRMLPILGKILRIGYTGFCFLLSEMKEKDRQKAWNKIKEIVGDDNLISFSNQMNPVAPSDVSQTLSNQTNWVTGISYTIRVINAFSNISMAVPPIGMWRGAGGVSGAVPTLGHCIAGGVAIGFNLLAIGLDIYHLVKIALEKKEPQYIQQLRDAVRLMEQQLEGHQLANFEENKKNA